MKRRVLMLALFLVLGAIVNVAVAWVCSTTHLHRDQTGAIDRSVARWWEQRAPPGFNFEPKMANYRRTGFREYLMLPPYPRSSSEGYDVRRDRSGWPMLSMEMSYWYLYAQNRNTFLDAWRVRLFDEDDDELPLRPIWPGFAINTAFYAWILWGLFAAPFALRRRRRIKRGLCPKCAYPVGESDKCTECGAARTVTLEAGAP